MQTQRDHLHAHQFLMGRLSSALVLGNPASAEVPARRALTGLMIGIVIAVLIGVACGVIGALLPSGRTSTTWQQSGLILVDAQSGSRFVYLNGTLYPVLNEASAMLITGDLKVQTVAHSTLAGVRRGEPIGITNAPEVVPAPSDLVVGPWLVCLPNAASGGTSLRLDLDPDTSVVALPGNRAVIVADPDHGQFLVFGGRKYPIADPTVPVALGMAESPVLKAPNSWLAALPAGQEIGAAAIPGAGEPGPSVGNRSYSLGQLFQQRSINGDEQLFVLRSDGLAPLSATEFALLAAHPGSPAPVTVTSADVAGAAQSADRSLLTRLPDLTGLQPLASNSELGKASLCLSQHPAGASVTSDVVLTEVTSSSAAVEVKPGTGMLVGALPVPKGQTAVRYLITDQGVKYLLPDDQSTQALGFSGVSITPMSSDLLNLIPSGPALSRAALS